jgi:SPP1 gp7 family putative phage head morphogenesis protein
VPSLLVRELAETALVLAEAAQPGARVVGELRKEQTRLETQMARELDTAFQALGVLVSKAVEDQGGLVIEASREETSRIMAVLAAADVKSWGEKTIGPMIERQWKRVLDSTLRIMDLHDIKVSKRSKLEKRILKMGGTRKGLVDVLEDTKTALFRSLDRGRAKGMNPREVAKLVQQEVPKGRFVNAGSRYRAELIARTETLEAQRHASLQSYEASDVVTAVVAFDGDKDDECAARNGTEYTFEEATAQADGTHPNCVLAFGPVV